MNVDVTRIICTIGHALSKGYKITEANKDKNEAKFKFQYRFTRPQRCFDLDFDCIEENSSTLEPEFYTIFFSKA